MDHPYPPCSWYTHPCSGPAMQATPLPPPAGVPPGLYKSWERGFLVQAPRLFRTSGVYLAWVPTKRDPTGTGFSASAAGNVSRVTRRIALALDIRFAVAMRDIQRGTRRFGSRGTQAREQHEEETRPSFFVSR